MAQWGGGSCGRRRSRALGNEGVLPLAELLYETSLDDARPRPATDPETEPAGGPAPAHGEQTERVDLEGFGQSGAVMMRPSAAVSSVLRVESGR